MTDTDQLARALSSSDPLEGDHALQALVALGARGEEALFSRPIDLGGPIHVRRRWLRYVATRSATIAPRLLERLADPERLGDGHASAVLCAGLPYDRTFMDPLFEQLEHGFTYSDYYSFSYRYVAWGHAGGDAATLWHLVSADSFRWEKLRTFAFRGACASCARRNEGDLFALEQLITHRWLVMDGLAPVNDAPDPLVFPIGIIGTDEMILCANEFFGLWRRGKVVDEVLRRWSAHPHWRVRMFGASALAAIAFQRAVSPVTSWLAREPVEQVREALLLALARAGTPAGADALLAHYRDSGEGSDRVARAAWRASDRQDASGALAAIAEGGDIAASEALVSLARLGVRHAELEPTLDAGSDYQRLNAALAYGYLGERFAVARLDAMQHEAATSQERVFLAAALAMLDPPGRAAALHRELVAAGANADDLVDLMRLHDYLREAVLDALAAGGAAAQTLLATWRSELAPFEPAPSRVVVRAAATTPVAGASGAIPGTIVSSPPPRSAHAIPDAMASGATASAPTAANAPLQVFISYSHRDERMRKALGNHLQPMVNEGLIRIWHDREIEAGADWDGEINREIDEADLVLLLVSAWFLGSPHCRKELMRALAQRRAREATVVPIILRPCDWQSTFTNNEYRLQALPRDNQPVAGGAWRNHDAAYERVVSELRDLVERRRAMGRISWGIR